MALTDELDELFNCSFGFDWGTYSSLLAVQDGDSKPQIASYSGNNRHGIPSLFYRAKDGKEYCCNEAIGAGSLDPANVCRSIKMKLSEKEIVLNGHSYSPVEIAEKLTKFILQTSQEAFEEDFIEFDPATSKLVCGVPVRFDTAERGQVYEIMCHATGASSIRLVSEPILAAYAYDYFLKGRNDRPVLCFDCGAGTFDVCVLKSTPNGEYPYTVCDGLDGIRIAGDHLDELTAELILEKLQSASGNLDLSRLTDSIRYQADYQNFRGWQTREVKEALSECTSYTMPITTLDGTQSCNVTITREEFEEKIRPSIQQMIDVAKKVLDSAKLGSKPDIRILMVGGSCNIPLMKTMLKEAFPWVKDIHLRNPQQMVALGAALYAKTDRKAFVPKVSYGYAVDTYYTPLAHHMLHVEIPSDVKLPARITNYYDTRYEGQETVRFNIYEVEHGEKNQYLELNQGRKMNGEYYLVHHFGKPVPINTTVRLDTELDEDGRLTMAVDDISISGTITRKTFTIVNTYQSKL